MSTLEEVDGHEGTHADEGSFGFGRTAAQRVSDLGCFSIFFKPVLSVDACLVFALAHLPSHTLFPIFDFISLFLLLYLTYTPFSLSFSPYFFSLSLLLSSPHTYMYA